MGRIISSENLENSKKCRVVWEGDCREFQQLFGSRDNVFLFSSDNPLGEMCKISGRGQDSKTKYFLIQQKWRDDLNITDRDLPCQRIESDKFVFFIYGIEKKTKN